MCLATGLWASSVFAQSPTIQTYVGPPALPVSGASATASFVGGPASVLPDGTGGVYVGSSIQHRIYRVTAEGTLQVIAGNGQYGSAGDGGPATAAQLSFPTALVLDLSGALYIADSGNNRIRKIDSSGKITTVAGNGQFGSGGDGGPATSAQISFPSGVAVDAVGNLYIADGGNNRIRKVNTTGTISTVAGTGTRGFAGDGAAATAAQLTNPQQVALDSAGNLFIADTGNGRIRKVTPSGTITSVAGNGSFDFGGDGGPATSAALNNPAGIALDASGNLLIADIVNNRIRKVTSVGIISTVAGIGTAGFSGDGSPAVSAQLNFPAAVAVDTGGNLFIADTVNNRVRQVSALGVISTVGGNGMQGFSGDDQPQGVTLDSAGNLFVADTHNNLIRRVTPIGATTIIAGNGSSDFAGDGGPATAAQLSDPRHLAVDGQGNLFIADAINNRVRKITAAGIISTVAGSASQGFAGDGGPATAAQLNSPSGVAVDASGNLFIADSGNNVIRKVTPDGNISTIVGTGTGGFSGDTGPATSAKLSAPFAVAVDSSNNLFIADTSNNRIRKVTASGTITTVAGTGALGFSGDGGAAISAKLNFPADVAVDASGNLYIADSGNMRIRKVTTSGNISTVAGNGKTGFAGDGGPATAAQLNNPDGVAVDAAGNLFIADTLNNIIREVGVPPAPISFSLVDHGSVSLQTAGTAPQVSVAYAAVQPSAGKTTPAGLAILDYRVNNILVSEAGVSASPALLSGRIDAEINGPVDTGLAIANPNAQPATLSFYFTDSLGNNVGSGSTTIAANGQIAAFLDQAPFNGRSSLSGTFTFTSSVPVAAVALHGFFNERGEFLMTTLPVADLNAAASTSPVTFPQFADGAGWTTQVILVNPGSTALTGTLQFLNPSGQVVLLGLNGQVNNNFPYSIAPKSSLNLQTSGAGGTITVGSVRVTPNSGTMTPSGLAIFSYRSGGITIAQAGVLAVPAAAAFRLYAEASGDFSRNAVGSTQTGLAVANTSITPATVNLELFKSDGSSMGLTGTISLPGNGQSALFLNQVPGFAALPSSFQGVLRVSGPSSISVIGLRGRYNERADFLMTTTPPINEATGASTSALYFPHLADGGGFTTQFVLFSGQAGQSSTGTLQLFSQSGGSLNLTVR